jgi:hypothetical protein
MDESTLTYCINKLDEELSKRGGAQVLLSIIHDSDAHRVTELLQERYMSGGWHTHLSIGEILMRFVVSRKPIIFEDR